MEPVDAVTITTGVRNNAFITGEAMVFSLAGEPRLGSVYKVRNIAGEVVAQGNANVPSISLSDLPLGWYKLYVLRAVERADATYGRSQGSMMFSVWRSTAGFPGRPAIGADIGNDSNGGDIAMRGLLLSGVGRLLISSASAPTTGGATLAKANADATLQNTYWVTKDTSRTKAQLCCFPNGTVGATTGVQSVVNTLKDRVSWWETRNEPDQTVSVAAYVAELTEFRSAVLGADATAKILGPAITTINATKLAWWSDFFTQGGGALIDGVSFHEYNSVNGDLNLARRSYDAWIALLVTHGQENKPRWMTEWGTFAAADGVLDGRGHGRWTMLGMLIREQYGIPKERTHHFYDRSHGFWDYPSFWQTESGELYPVATLMRVFSEEVFGKTYAAALDFGTVDNRMYVGNRYSEGTDTVLAVMAVGRVDGSIVLSVTGASSLTTVSSVGVQSTVAVSGGTATIPVGVGPVYVRVPSGVTATVSARTYGTNLAPSATATASTGGTNVARVNDGLWRSAYYSDTNAPDHVDAPHYNQTLPATIELAWGSAQTIDTVIVHAPTPWQFQCSLLDFDLQYWDGSAWIGISTATYVPTAIASVVSNERGGTRADSFFDHRHVFQFEFADITTTKVRLVVRDATYGSMPNAMTAGVSSLDGWKAATVTEIEVYRRT